MYLVQRKEGSESPRPFDTLDLAKRFVFATHKPQNYIIFDEDDMSSLVYSGAGTWVSEDDVDVPQRTSLTSPTRHQQRVIEHDRRASERTERMSRVGLKGILREY